MKSKNVILILVSLLIGLVAGLLIGVMISNPGVSLRDAAGTIGKVEKYRNVKITEADIELRNELISDPELRYAFTNYVQYEYAASIKLGEDIAAAVSAARSIPAFMDSFPNAASDLENYGALIENARLPLLEASAVMDQPDQWDNIAFTSVVNNAGMAMFQIRQGAAAAYDFLSAAETFFIKNDKSAYPDLNIARLQIYFDMLASGYIRNDRMAFEYLLSKSKDVDIVTATALKSEALQLAVIADANKLNIGDASQLGVILNVEKLGIIVWSATTLGQLICNTEKLGLGFCDAEKLNYILSDAGKLDFIAQIEKLASGDAEKMGRLFDSEKINLVANQQQLGVIFGVEKLGNLGDKNQLGVIMDFQQLGSTFQAVEKLQLSVIMNVEKLSVIY